MASVSNSLSDFEAIPESSVASAEPGPGAGRRKKNFQPKRKRAVSYSPKRGARKAPRRTMAASIEITSDELSTNFATADRLYETGGVYYDLGYVTDSLARHGLPETAWNCRGYSFRFVADQLLLTGMEEDMREKTLIALGQLTHFRLVWSRTELDGVTKTGSAILICPKTQKSTGLPRVIHGQLHFPAMPPANRAGGWVDWTRTGHDCPACLPVDALRHFAVNTLPNSDSDQIPLPSIPKTSPVTKNGFPFQLEGNTSRTALPRLCPVLNSKDPKKRLYFVASPQGDGLDSNLSLNIDVYVTEVFFGGFGPQNDVLNSVDIATLKDGRRLQFLLDCHKPTSLTNSPFLETLFLEKHYQPTLQPQKTGKHLVTTIDPQHLQAIYNHIKAVHADQGITPQPDPQHPGLRLTLHDYQRRAVSWMIQREYEISQASRHPHPLVYPVCLDPDKTVYLHHQTSQVTFPAPTVACPQGGILADEMGLGKTLEVISLILANRKGKLEPFLPVKPRPVEGVPGWDGVLQCHCGFRKKDFSAMEIVVCGACGTVQHARCMQAEFVPEGETFVCSACLRDCRIECKTSLVVAPAAIIHQWQSEITKSCQDGLLSVYHYRGVATEQFLSPWRLAQFDIVLASYEMLSQELPWVTAETRKAALRRVSIHQIIPSPLLSLKFHRFLLDEAQMVESQTSNYAKMAHLIQAHTYWAVTGTPIQRAITDLQALLQFINAPPWGDPASFHAYLIAPYRSGVAEPLYEALSACMWRLEKTDVETAMQLPECTTVLHRLRFSGIEKQLYQQVYRDCIHVVTGSLKRDLSLRVSAYTMPFGRLGGRLVKVVKEWMGTLAKLCTSPTRVSYIFRVAKRVKNALASEEDDGLDALGRVSRALTEKARLDFENALRICLMNRNALAAYFWLNNDYAGAAEEYRTAKRLCLETEGDVTVDILQKLHILTNLGELLTDHRDSIPGRTVEDDDIPQQAAGLRAEFVNRKRAHLTTSVQAVQRVWVDDDGAVIATPNDLGAAIRAIYRAVDGVDTGRHADFLSEIKLATVARATAQIYRNDARRNRPIDVSYTRKDGLSFTIQNCWQKMMEERAGLDATMHELIEKSTTDDVAFTNHCASCHLRTWGLVGLHVQKCGLCVAEKSLDAYGDLIFDLQTEIGDGAATGDAADDDLTEPGWDFNTRRQKHSTEQEGDFETTVKAIVQFFKRKYPADYERAEPQFRQLFQMLTVMKKEYKLWRELFRSIYDYTSCNDEIKQAVLRVRFMTEDEAAFKEGVKKRSKEIDALFKWLIPPTDNLTVKIATAKSQLNSSIQDMNRTWMHFKYTRNMQKAYTENEQVQGKDCIVCFESVRDNWAMFPCAHVVCQDCRQRMLEEGSSGSGDRTLACPLCRKPAKGSEILTQSQVLNPKLAVEVHSFSSLQLRGAPSKVEVVVRTVFDLLDKDVSTKILIFSDYADVLEDYSTILQRNGLAAYLVKSKSLIPAAVAKLRDDSARILLMPISMGGKGLTITEANHLFFLEPLTNKGAELQAIGRIHRMGQTRPTFIHKFVVEDTVEDRIYQWMNTPSQTASLSQPDMTLGQILDLLKSTGSHGPDMVDLNHWITLAKQESGLASSSSQDTPSTSQAVVSGVISEI